MLFSPRNLSALGLVAGVAFFSVSHSPAGEPETRPAVGGLTADPVPPSLLQQLSDDTERAYNRARRGTVVVQLPPNFVEKLKLDREQALLKSQQEFIDQWAPRLDPEVLKTFRAIQAKSLEQFRREQNTAATRPAGTEDTDPPPFVLVGKGLLLDKTGDVLIREYIEPGDMPNAVSAQTADGHGTTATFVGSDKITRLTVVRLKNPSGDPVSISPGRPRDGSLVLALNPGGNIHLAVWTSLHPEPGLIVEADGSISGFAGDDGAFLAIATAKPVFDQLIATGKVRRAQLGVSIREVSRDDPARMRIAPLGSAPALRVLSVLSGSAADVGKLKPNDLILTVDGQPVGDAATFAAVIAARNGNTPLKVLRDSETVELTVEMKPPP